MYPSSSKEDVFFFNAKNKQISTHVIEYIKAALEGDKKQHAVNRCEGFDKLSS